MKTIIKAINTIQIKKGDLLVVCINNEGYYYIEKYKSSKNEKCMAYAGEDLYTQFVSVNLYTGEVLNN